MSPRKKARKASRSLDFEIRSGDVPRDLFPTGRVKFSLGVARASDARDAEATRRRVELLKLRGWRAWDVLRAIQDGQLNVAIVATAIENNGRDALPELRRQLEMVRIGAVPTLDQEKERYLAWHEKHRGEQTHAGVRARLGKILGVEVELTPGEPAVRFGGARVDQVTKAHVERAIHALDVAPSTRETYRTTLSGLFTWSIEDEAETARTQGRAARWSVNPTSKVEVGYHSPRKKTASEEQVLSLVAAAEPYQLAYLRAFLHLGLRRDELRHTRLHDDLDLETWHWTIQPRGPDARCGCPQCRGSGWKPKGWPRFKNSLRTILVPEVRACAEPGAPELLRTAIADYLAAYPCEPGDFVFRNPRTGMIWTVAALTRDFKALCERADVRYGQGTPGGLHLHILRHTCATRLVQAGERESVIAALLGDTVDSIVKNYVHLTEEDLANAVRRGPSYALRSAA